MESPFQGGNWKKRLLKLAVTFLSVLPVGRSAPLEGGELMRPLPPSPTLWMVLAKPAALGVSTAEVYRALDGVKDRKETDTDACVAALEHHDTKALLSALN